jgi:uncharacterized protein YbjT (DUF2867 family)
LLALAGDGKAKELLMSSDTTLVIGGTGKTGRRVVERLRARDLPVRVGSRSADLPFDWENSATWEPARTGVGAVYLTYAPDLAVPGSVEAVRTVVDLALSHGAHRIVVLTGRGEEEAIRAEDVVRASGADWTILRASWFAQNFSESDFRQPLVSGELALPAGPIGEPFVSTDDIADVAVAALTDDRHIGELYELTGPRLLTFADVVAEIAAATGREIRYLMVSAEDYAAALADAGVPADFVWLMTYLFTTVLDGRNASVTDGIQRALGRAARDFTTYARSAAADGAWAA